MFPMPAPLLSLLLLAPAADGWLGIYLEDRDEAVVREVIPDSPAAKAGLQMGDVLLAVGDQATPTRAEFVARIQAAKVGDRLSIKIRRGGIEQLVVVKLGQRPDQVPGSPVATPTRPSRPQAPAPVQEVPPAPAPQRGYLGLTVRETDGGVVVERVLPDGPAAKAGVREGEAVTSVGDLRIRNLEDLDAALRPATVGRTLAIGLRSDAGTRSVLVTLGKRPDAAEAAPAPIAVAPVAPAPAEPPVPPGPRSGRKEADLEAELAALRAELADLRKQLEALRQGKGRE